ncbi:OLC1v1035991C1 [Oldenlandia corymbosa var. corymbosa]|uniref:OLC1v1035991C1 n=1 Tax=Oldenlandia corymbosa var. corymbosa TaxID=529605 RepID=A0AAV1CUB9_OLDCO|nr:OLC1v1035991C1 [Oldenlandia corymbosa var. corymbosa]
MYSRFTRRLITHLHHHLRTSTSTTIATSAAAFRRRHHHHSGNSFSSTFPKFNRANSIWQPPPHRVSSDLRFLSTRSGRPNRSARPDIGARARQLQNRRLWTYALTFSCIAGFIVIVINQFQDQLVFYVTPTDALAKYTENPSKSKFRLGGLVLEGSLTDVPTSPEMEFVITDLMTDILVKYDGSLPDLFREGHSVVVEGFIRPFPRENDETVAGKGQDPGKESSSSVSEKARSLACYFKATEVLAKHDEKYMPPEVASAIEKNKKILSEEQQKHEAENAAAGGKGLA